MSKNTALIVVVSGSNAPEPKTHFGNFMALILSRGYQKPLSTLAGQASWISAPLEEIVLSGLWVLVEKLAGVLRESITTKTQAQKIAARVERLVVIGFFLVYGSVERAAEAFEMRVLGVTNRATELGYRPGMDISAAHWNSLLSGSEQPFASAAHKSAKPTEAAPLALYAQIPAALFFAELVKTAREARRNLTTLCTEVKQKNTLETDNFAFCERGVSPVFEHILPLLDEGVDQPQNTTDAFASTVGGFLKYATELLRDQTVMRALKFDHTSWPTDSRSHIVLDYNWLNTQVILAQLQGIPEKQESLESVEQYLEGIRFLHKRTHTEAVSMARSRLTNYQKRPFSADEEAAFLETITGRVAKISAWGFGFRISNIDLVLVHVNADSLNISPTEALDIATQADTASLTILWGRKISAEQFVKKQVAPKIDWKSLRLATALKIISEGVLPPHSIATGIKKMKNIEDRRTAAAMLLKKGRFDGASLHLLASIITFEWQFVLSNIKHFEAKTLEKLLPKLLQDLNDPEVAKDSRNLTELLWRILPHLSANSVQNIAQDMRWRRALCDMVHEFFPKGESSSYQESLVWPTYDTVRKLMGDRAFQLLALSEYSAWRAECYRTGRDKDDQLDSGLVRWHELYLVKQASAPHPRVFGPGVDALKANEIVRGIPEEEAIRWICADEPDVDTQWRELHRLRETFWASRK
jgi:hypothetical protein